MNERRVQIALRHGECIVRKEITFKRGEPVVVTGDAEIEYLLSTGKFELINDLPFESKANTDYRQAQPLLDHDQRDAVASAEITSADLLCVDHVKQQKNSLDHDDLNGKHVLLKRHGNAIGDCVYVASVARDIKKRFPTCQIGLSTSERLTEFARLLGAFDEVVTAQEAARIVTLSKYDYVIQFDGVIESRSKDDADYFALHYAKLGEGWCAPQVFETMRVLSTAQGVANARHVLNTAGFGNDDYVAIVAGTSNPLKTIHVQQMEKLIAALTSDQEDAPRVRVLVLGSTADRMPNVSGNAFAYNAWEPLPTVVELLKGAKVVLGGDTGLVQLAAAMCVPTISYWGPTTPDFSITHYPGHVHAVQAPVECSPCFHLRAAYCDRLKSAIPECMRVVDIDALTRYVKATYEEARNVVNAPSLIDGAGGAAAKSIYAPADVRTLIATREISTAVLLDHSHTYTGGGFYLWTQALILAHAHKTMSVVIYVDSASCVYARDERDLPDNVYVVVDEKMRSWSDAATATLPWDYVIAGPPAMGARAISAKRVDRPRKPHVVLAVYETPEYIKAHRDGADGEEAYWEPYKAALREADTIFVISKAIRRSLEAWMPETTDKVRQVYPILRSDVADSVAGDVAQKLDPAVRGNNVLMIARNMKYKDMEECAQFILDKFAPSHAYDDDPFTLNLVGSGTRKLIARLRVPSGYSQTISVVAHEEIDEYAKWELLCHARALVHPSLFEGFGIPVAEALYACTPVFCRRLEVIKESFNKQTTFYEDHGGLLAALEDTWRKWDDTGKEQAAFLKKLRSGWLYVNKVYTMGHGRRTITDFVNATGGELVETARAAFKEKITSSSIEPRVAFVTTWNSKCGIAETTKQILAHAKFPYKVFAPRENENQLVEQDGGNVVRCWDKTFPANEDLLRSIQDFGANVVHIEHEYSFFHRTPTAEALFIDFLTKLRARGIKISVTMHTFAQHGFLDRLGTLVDYIVTTKLHAGDRVQNLHHIDLPVDGAQYRIGNDEAKQQLSWTDRTRFVVGAFGMWAEHKGFDGFLKTYDDVSARSMMDTRYMIVGYRQPNNQYAQDVIRKHSAQVAAERLALFSDYLPMRAVIAKLCAANVLVFNYQDMAHSSASAALRTGMISGRPIVCSNSAMFDEFEHERHVIKVPFGDTAALANAIVRVKNDPTLATKLVQECDRFLYECTPERIAEKHLALFRHMTQEEK